LGAQWNEPSYSWTGGTEETGGGCEAEEGGGRHLRGWEGVKEWKRGLGCSEGTPQINGALVRSVAHNGRGSIT